MRQSPVPGHPRLPVLVQTSTWCMADECQVMCTAQAAFHQRGQLPDSSSCHVLGADAAQSLLCSVHTKAWCRCRFLTQLCNVCYRSTSIWSRTAPSSSRRSMTNLRSTPQRRCSGAQTALMLPSCAAAPQQAVLSIRVTLLPAHDDDLHSRTAAVVGLSFEPCIAAGPVQAPGAHAQCAGHTNAQDRLPHQTYWWRLWRQGDTLRIHSGECAGLSPCRIRTQGCT